jgi:para-nitrobenzyl esterase
MSQSITNAGRARRRSAVSVTALLGTIAMLAASPARAQIVATPVPGDPVSIDSGAVSGKVLSSGVKAYFGIPYAAPPLGDLRWRAPQKVEAWKGVYNADRLASECIQVLRRHNLNHYFGEEATSEDCLYLNIWTSADAKSGAKLPVVVWIYGGGFTIGSSGMANYDGENVARKGTIFVSFNYRVGILGNLAHPELTAESPHRASGNYGLMDQVAALQWIKRNIAQFGGDPDNVTVTGQSAGAMSVSVLEASPLAKGLFNRGFAMSLSMFDNRFKFPALPAAEKIGLEVQSALGASSLAEMRLIQADKILAIQKDCQLGCAGTVSVTPDIDGYVLPDTVQNIFAAGKQNDVAIVAGFTSDESSNDLRTAGTLDAYVAAARKLYGDQADRFLALYPAKTDDQAKAMGLLAAREGLVEIGTRNWADAQTKTGKAPFYMYMFSRVHPFAANVEFFDSPQKIGAYHSSDVPYWFGTQDAFNKFRTTRVWTEFDRALSERMMDTLIAFARTGDPGTPAMPWPQWKQDAQKYVEFGDESGVREENRARLDFHTPANVTPSTPRVSRD